MNTQAAAAPSAEGDAAFDESGTRRELSGLAAKIVAVVALAFSAYQLVIAAFAPLSSLPTRSLHVGFLLALAFSINAAHLPAALIENASASRKPTCSERVGRLDSGANAAMTS